MNTKKKNYFLIFINETESLIDNIANLLYSTQEFNEESINFLFRMVHTLKGNAGCMNFKIIENLAHKIETLLDAARVGNLTIDKEIKEIILEWFDINQSLFASVKENKTDTIHNINIDSFLEKLINILNTKNKNSVETKKNQLKSSEQNIDKISNNSLITDKISDIEYLKVNIKHLDSIANTVSEMMINNLVLEKTIRREYPILQQTIEKMLAINKRLLGDIHKFSFSMRMVSLNQIFIKLPNIVRNAAAKLKKQVNFVTRGADTEIECGLVNSLQDPLLHLMRNSIDHSIETPEKRLSSNKPAEASLTITARRGSQNRIEIIVEDDGRGFNIEKIKQKAIERGLVNADNAEHLTDDEIIQFIFKPGFSTAEVISDISGRGVGMDVVLHAVKQMRGEIKAVNITTGGSRCAIYLPAKITLISALIFKTAGMIFATPLDIISDTLTFEESEIITLNIIEKNIYYNEKLTLLINTNKLLKFNYICEKKQEKKGSKFISAIVSMGGGSPAVFMVDEIIEQESIIIKPINQFIKTPPFIIGFAVLGHGEPAAVIDFSKFTNY